jgi:hypothetical protein
VLQVGDVCLLLLESYPSAPIHTGIYRSGLPFVEISLIFLESFHKSKLAL